MARYIELDQKKLARLKREAQLFQDDIVCAVGTDFMQNIADAENKMIFDILKGLEDEPTADVVPKSEVEELIRENESLAKTVNEASELIRKLRSKVKKSKTEVAREIFEEIENMVSPMLGLEDDKEYVAILSKNFAELKKKYAGEKECPNCRYFVGCECFDGKTCDEYEEKKE